MPATILKAHAGRYASVTWRFPNAPARDVTRQRLDVVLKGTRLVLHQDDGKERVLVPVTRHHFRFADETVAGRLAAGALGASNRWPVLSLRDRDPQQ